MKNTLKFTHSYHPFSAKFPPQTPRYYIEKFSSVGDVVLDPFLGSGTTLVECMLLNRDGIGIDINPIFSLISNSKTTLLNNAQLDEIKDILSDIKDRIQNMNLDNRDKLNLIDFPNRDHWFQKNVVTELSF